MSRQHRAWAVLLAGGWLLAGPVPAAFAQPAAAPADAPLPPVEAEEDSLLVRQPANADEALAATALMVDLGRPQLARRYLQRTLEFIGDDEDQLLDLRDRHGPAVFLRLARNRDLQPLSTELLDRSNQAVARRQRDPRYLDALIDGLAGTPQERAVSIVTLEGIGPAAVPRILQRLEAPQGAVARDVLVFSLARMGGQIVPPLIAAIGSPSEGVQQLAIEVLGWLRAPEAVPHLWRPAFGPGTTPALRDSARQALARIERGTAARVDESAAFGAARRLKEIALAHFAGKAPWETDPDGLATVWTWLPEDGTVGPVRMPPATASMFVGLQYARELLALVPSDTSAQALVVAFALGWDALQAGWDRPLPTGPGTAHDLAVLSGAGRLSEAVSLSLEHGNALAALATLQTLSVVATRAELLPKPGLGSPVLAALNFPDSRVQFAAATTVLQLDPVQPFPGSHRVVEILARSLADAGNSGLLVIDPNEPRGIAMATFIAGLGFDGQTVGTGREGFRLAAERGDVELVAAHANSIDWELTPTIVNFRADARTAAIPIVIYGPEFVEGRVQRLIERYPLVTFIVEGTQPAFVQDQLRPMLDQLVGPALTPRQRADRTAAAAYWLARVGRRQPDRLFDLSAAEAPLFEALRVPAAAENALLALASIPTAGAQSRVGEIVTGPAIDPGLRAAAAVQLALHIQRHGLLLADREVVALRQAWQTETDPGVRSAITVVLGTLRPDADLAAERLLRVPPPRPPRAAAP